MFKLKLSDPKLFNNLVSIVSEFVTEATFSVRKDGMKLVAIDPANISMITLNILPSAFDEYSVTEDSEVTINLESLRLALRRTRPTDLVTLTTSESKLNVSLTGSLNKRFSIPLLEKAGSERKEQTFDFKSQIDMNSNEFKEFIEDVGVVSDAVTFEAEPSKFVISAGDTGSRVKIDLTPSDDIIVNFKVKERCHAIYSVVYLKKVAKAASISDVVSMQFSSDYPLKAEFKALDRCVLSFVLAPRIENR